MKLFSKCLSTLAQVRSKIQVLIHDCALLPSRAHAAIFTLSLLVSRQAMATGITGFFTGWTAAINAITTLILNLGMMMGVGACMYGLWQLTKKGMNRGEEVEWSKITWPLIGGALLTIILFVIQAVVEQGGGSRSDMGRTS